MFEQLPEKIALAGKTEYLITKARKYENTKRGKRKGLPEDRGQMTEYRSKEGKDLITQVFN
jgi:hypothetical protein